MAKRSADEDEVGVGEVVLGFVGLTFVVGCVRLMVWMWWD